MLFGTVFLQQTFSSSYVSPTEGGRILGSEPALHDMPKTSSMLAGLTTALWFSIEYIFFHLGYCIISTLAVAAYIVGRYIQIKKNSELQRCDSLSPSVFVCSILANICTLICVGLQADFNDLGFYTLIHTPSLIFALVCIPLDGYILHQIYKYRPEHIMYQPLHNNV